MDPVVRMFKVACRVGDQAKNRGLIDPEDVAAHNDLPYGPGGREQLLDVYTPRDRAPDALLPVVISVHGGGWVYGSKEPYRYYCMSLARQGFGVVNFTYRLAPEHPHPSQMVDLDRVVRWTLDRGRAYGLDPQRVFLVGDSAGGHLAALYGCICTNPDCARFYPTLGPKGFVPLALALNCGVYRLEKGPDLIGRLAPQLLGEWAGEEAYRAASPLNFITRDFPPTFLMTANLDFLRPQAQLLREKLGQEGVSYRYRVFGTDRHPLGHVFQCDLRLPQAARCNREEMAFFREICRRLDRETGPAARPPQNRQDPSAREE